MIAFDISINGANILRAGMEGERNLSCLINSFPITTSAKFEQHEIQFHVMGNAADLTQMEMTNWPVPSLKLGDQLDVHIVELPLEAISPGTTRQLSKDNILRQVDKVGNSHPQIDLPNEEPNPQDEIGDPILASHFTIAFEILINDKKIALAGLDGNQLLSSLIQSRLLSRNLPVEQHEIEIMVFGKSSDTPETGLKTWPIPSAKLGDTISIKVIKAPLSDITEGTIHDFPQEHMARKNEEVRDYIKENFPGNLS